MPSKSYNLKTFQTEHPSSNNNKNVVNIDESHAKELRSVPYEEALKMIGFGKIQILVFLSTFMLLTNVISETMGISFIIPAAICDLNLTPAYKGLLNGTTFFGIMIASYPLGFMGDTKGRRKVVLWTVLGSTCSSIISAFIQNFILFLIFRVFTGIFLAGYSAIMYTYLGEYVSNNKRPAMLSWVTTSVGVATMIMPLLAFWILSYTWSFELYSGFIFLPWRLLLLMYTIPGIVGGLILFIFLKPSPKFLLSIKKEEEALEVVKWMYRQNNGKSDATFNIGRLISEDSDMVKGSDSFWKLLSNQTLPLLKPPYLKYFAVCCFLMFGLFFVASGMAMYTPELFNKLALTNDKLGYDSKICGIYDVAVDGDKKVCTDEVSLKSYLQIVILGAGYTFGFIALSVVVRRNNRKYLLIGSYLLSGGSGIVLTFLTNQYAILVFFCIFVVCAGMTVPLINGSAVDIFPTYLRSMAVSCSMLFGRLGATVSTNLIGNIIENNCEATFYSIASLVIICALVAFIIPRPK